MSRYQKGKTNLDFTVARDSEWQWHPLGHMQVCTLLQTDDHASTPPLSFLQAGCPSCRPTNSVKALKTCSLASVNFFLLFCKRTFTISSTCASCRLDISLKAHQSVGKNYLAIIVSCLHIIIMSLLHNISRQYIVNYTCFLTVISFSQLILINVIYFGFHWTSCCFVCMF